MSDKDDTSRHNQSPGQPPGQARKRWSAPVLGIYDARAAEAHPGNTTSDGCVGCPGTS